jgi:hypothetical protein
MVQSINGEVKTLFIWFLLFGISIAFENMVLRLRMQSFILMSAIRLDHNITYLSAAPIGSCLKGNLPEPSL